MSNPVYFNAPVELWRGFLDKPKDILEDVLNYASAVYGDEDTASKALNVTYGSWESAKENGDGLRKRKDYSGVTFSIPSDMYWEHRNHNKGEEDRLFLLGYLALKSIGGHGRISCTNSAFMFCRMAGYGRMEDFRKEGFKYDPKKKKWNRQPESAILRYMRTDKMRGYHCEKLRYALMEAFDNFHCYSRKGKRGFAFIFGSEHSREEYWKMMAKHFDERGNDSKRNLLKEQMRKITQDY